MYQVSETQKSKRKHVLPISVFLVFFAFSAFAGIPDSLQRVNAIITCIPDFPPAVHGLSVDEGGVLYFSDTYSKMDVTSRIYTLSPPYTGTPVSTDISGQSISGLMWFEDLFYVAYLNKNEIRIFNDELEEEEIWYTDAPWNFTTDKEHIFVVTYGGEVGVLSGGNIKPIISELNYPFDIEDNGENAIWITEKYGENTPGKVTLRDYQGEILETIDFEFKNPQGIALDHRGNLYIADTGDDKIYQISPSGNIRLLSDEYTQPICIAVRSDGSLIVNTNHNGGSLLVIRIK